MTVIVNAAVERHAIPGVVNQTLASAATGLKHLSMWRNVMDPGAATPPHRHDCEEVVLVLSGRGEVHLGGEVVAFGPDCTLVIPPHVDHLIVNTGGEPMVTVAAFSATPVGVTLPDGTAIELPWPT